MTPTELQSAITTDPRIGDEISWGSFKMRVYNRNGYIISYEAFANGLLDNKSAMVLSDWTKRTTNFAQRFGAEFYRKTTP